MSDADPAAAAAAAVAATAADAPPAAAATAADAPPAADPEAAAAAMPPPGGGFKQRKNRANIRKRAADADDTRQAAADAEGDDTSVVRRAKQSRGEPLAFSTKADTKEELGLTFSSVAGALAAQDSSAFRTLETETQFDRDARAQREKVLSQSVAGSSQGDSKYRGMAGYVDYRAGFRREQTVGAEKGAGAHGPLRGNVFVRTTARFDYQPDICKDYKETGFCSYGDSCKFLHDRGDYKSGWELEREWDEEQKRKQEALTKGWKGGDDSGEEEEEEEEDDGLPFACFICRRPWQECSSDPVVTPCQHYFCESCALKHNTKSGKCAACEQPTRGIFNVATDILKKMKKMKAGGS